ncbi:MULTISPECIES: nucleoside 2-deoxyribosyltransferase [unclassified Caballeronia]|uniref:nucleoside 2-deoxyribosyltransferase n=1 Tax=unclassified Caballeronia TaxID=2646786 RepID=UPI0020286BF6|nr:MULTISPECIES: nucleoside 2-deoxyribosyltransferase [unclassified Caballeronia]MDR5785025.1 nucleoside 2-deoxyribosyltransferase [Caballeronia sp. LP003]
MEQLDRGLSVEQIAADHGKSVLAVRRQVARIKRRVREGNIAPAPLPIERVAAEARIYLAGFDVFRRDAKEHGEHLKQLCRDRGFVGLYPLDGQVPCSLQRQDAARWIYAANIELIRSADIVMANLDDFRGSGEPDSGTAFEVGFAAALGKPVWAYRSNEGTLVERVKAAAIGTEGGFCAGGYLIEDFGLSVNLMLACSARIVVGGPAACLDAIRSEVDQGTARAGGSGLAKR